MHKDYEMSPKQCTAAELGPANMDTPSSDSESVYKEADMASPNPNGLMLSLSITKWHSSLNSQSPVYDGDRQAPPDLSNLLGEGTDSDSDT
jgi:hypothetical protein